MWGQHHSLLLEISRQWLYKEYHTSSSCIPVLCCIIALISQWEGIIRLSMVRQPGDCLEVSPTDHRAFQRHTKNGEMGAQDALLSPLCLDCIQVSPLHPWKRMLKCHPVPSPPPPHPRHIPQRAHFKGIGAKQVWTFCFPAFQVKQAYLLVLAQLWRVSSRPSWCQTDESWFSFSCLGFPPPFLFPTKQLSRRKADWSTPLLWVHWIC